MHTKNCPVANEKLQFSTSNESQGHILLTVDVEDWFQVENLKNSIPFSSWASYEMRVERNTHRLLDLLDSTHTSPIGEIGGAAIAKMATFFVLGWIAQRNPGLVREIRARGHEIASHGYNHSLCGECSPHELKEDLLRSKKLLEDISGSQILGYRAPSFSVNEKALKIIHDCGYLYDSSFNSVHWNQRYGSIELSNEDREGVAYRIADQFYELPISNIRLKKCTFPAGGGGYFRLIPISIFIPIVRFILRKVDAYVFYLHPWEIDPLQPKIANASLLSRFRHYHNLSKTLPRLSMFMHAFKDCHFITCSNYLHLNTGLTGRPLDWKVE